MAAPDYGNTLSGIPTDKVIEMRSAGLSNNQIIQNLQREGFTQTQIFDAMNQAEAKGGVESISKDSPSSYPPANPMAMGQEAQSPQQAQPSPQSPQIGQQPSAVETPQMPGADFSQLTSVSTEELVEALINEKWNEIVKDITKIAEWKEKADSRVAKVEQEFDDLKKNFDQLHNAVVGKIGEYDKHIMDVGAEIQAMEKVFQKVLPSFTDNVRELSRITDNMKKK